MADLPAGLVRELEPLRKQIHEQRNVVFPVVGSGLSFKLGSWDKLLESLIERASPDAQTEMRQALAAGDYLGVAGYLESLPAIGVQTIASTIREKFHLTGQKRRERPETYDLVAALPLEHFATTNYDPWLKDAVTKKLGFPPRVYTPTDPGAFNDIATSSDPLVLMIHGDADRPESCVLSEQGFRRLTHGNPSYMRGMQALVSSRSLLFIGHSMKDPDLRIFLDEWSQTFTPDGGAPRHWILGVGLTDLQRGAFLRKGVMPISYGPAGDHSLLPDVLRHLALPLGGDPQSVRGASSSTPVGGSSPTQAGASESKRPDSRRPPTGERFDPPAAIPTELVHTLAEEYPDVTSARLLWQRAGGKISEVENITQPRNLWQQLWRRSSQGASVRPIRLLCTALEDLPNNSILLRHLGELAPPPTKEAAESWFARLEATQPVLTKEVLWGWIEDWEEADEGTTFAALLNFKNRLPSARRSELREVLATLLTEHDSGAQSQTLSTPARAMGRALLKLLKLT